MKKILSLLFILIISISSQAQWVTIHDANFVAKLQLLYPTCMNGNQMDTTCFSITNAYILDCGSLSIQNLEGVKYFDSLLELYCTFNQLTSLPSLPSTLTTLYCNYNQLASLSSLPGNLEILNCESNLLSSLPALPSSLLQLTCSSNPISTLPSLPNNLFWLAASYCQLTSLPSLPVH